MCNSLHDYSTPIPEEGYGYKIFRFFDDEDFYSVFSHIEYQSYEDGYAKWMFADRDQGFCFCLSKEECERLRNDLRKFDGYDNCVVRKIHYRKGLGQHREYSITVYTCYETALCKEFKILNEEGGENDVR